MQDNENDVIVRIILNLLSLKWRDKARALIFMTIFSNKLAILAGKRTLVVLFSVASYLHGKPKSINFIPKDQVISA